MGDGHEGVDAWLRRYGAAWTERDPDEAAALFAPGAEYWETPFDPPFVGREAIREYWSNVPRSQVDITFESTTLAVVGAAAIAHWRAAFTRVATGRRVELDGVFVLRFDEAGLCAELREWWHGTEEEVVGPGA